MVFSSMVFLCVFLPVTFLLYTIIPWLRIRNILLIAASLLFYSYGEPVYVLLLIASAVVNYLAARGIAGAAEKTATEKVVRSQKTADTETVKGAQETTDRETAEKPQEKADRETAEKPQEKADRETAEKPQEKADRMTAEKPQKTTDRKTAEKLWLAAAVILNLGILCIFKYTGFLVQSFYQITGLTGAVPQIALPVGISFFTFQALSYVIDVYRGETAVQKNFGKVLLYISFFPQLIAGPIVKYHDIAAEIEKRKQTMEGVSAGIRRFIAGLGKKVLIANFMAQVADGAFGAGAGEINVLVAWLGAIAYMLQIYFDFSGYSDMAIGLGWMFGFHFKENFRYPYCADSIRDFWRRWHISLSSWFRDYLYIPLGGNRKGRARACLNKFFVFLCTGIWHGANVTFLFWGIYHGFFLLLEEFIPFFRKKVQNPGMWLLRHMYMLLVVLVGFVFFRAETMSQGLAWIGQMFSGFHFEAECMRLLLSLLTPANLIALAAGIIGSLPWREHLAKKRWYPAASYALSIPVFVLCLLNLAGGTYNPFIYFRF